MNISKKILGSVVLATLLAVNTTGCGSDSKSDTEKEKVALVAESQNSTALTTYANLALNNYSNALSDASNLVTACATFTAVPSEASLKAAKDAWKKVQLSYGTIGKPNVIYKLKR